MQRVVGWAVFVAALVGLGVLIHAGTAPRPRWRVLLYEDARFSKSMLLDGDRLLVIDDGSAKRLRLFEPGSGSVVFTAWEGVEFQHLSPIVGKRWAAGIGQGGDQPLRVVNLATGQERIIPEAREWAPRLRFSPDETTLVAWGDDNRGVAIDLQTGRCDPIAVPLGGTPEFGAANLLLIHYRTSVLLWGLREREVLGLLPTDGGYLVPVPGGRRLLLEDEGRFDLWDIIHPTRPRRLRTFSNPDPKPRTLVTADGRYLIIGPFSGLGPADAVRLWDLETGQLWWQKPLGKPGTVELAETPDGRYVFVREIEEAEPKDHRDFLIDPRERRVAFDANDLVLGAVSPDSRWVLCYPFPSEPNRRVEVTEVPSGNATTLLLPWDTFGRPDFRAGGRQLWVVGYRPREDGPRGWLEQWLDWLRPRGKDELLAYHWPSAGVLARFAFRTVEKYHVAADGSFVLVEEMDRGRHFLSRYDVPTPKPWPWIIGMPLLLGTSLLALRSWWNRRPRKEPAA